MLEEEDTEKSRTEQMHAIDSPHADLKKLHTADGDEQLLPNAHRFGDCMRFPSIDKTAENRGMEKPRAFRENQDANLDSTYKDNFVMAAAMESLEKQLPRSVRSDKSQQNSLPKSPSDSWLWRTLPSMATKNSSERPYLSAATNPETHCFKAPTSDMKWETIVKTTKVQRCHMHYSELSTAIYQQKVKNQEITTESESRNHNSEVKNQENRFRVAEDSSIIAKLQLSTTNQEITTTEPDSDSEQQQKVRITIITGLMLS